MHIFKKFSKCFSFIMYITILYKRRAPRICMEFDTISQTPLSISFSNFLKISLTYDTKILELYKTTMMRRITRMYDGDELTSCDFYIL